MNSFLEWVESTWFSSLVRDSRWGFAIAEIFHLAGLALLLGGVVLVSLRLAGLVMADRPVSEVAAEVRLWLLTGLAIMIASGISLWASEAVRMDGKWWFWFKMVCLVLAIVFQFAVFGRVTRKDDTSRRVRLLTAAGGLLLWFGVGFGGRAIGFL